MRRRAMVCCLMLMPPAAAAAQSLNGNADWGYSRSAYRTGADTTANGAFTQAYTLAYSSSLWDPRFAVYSGGVTFNRNALTFGGENSRSDQTGFNAAASLFSMRPFRLALHASRAAGSESANYPASSQLRSGLPTVAGAVPELATGQSEYGLNWVLSAPSLPRVEFSYQQGSGTVAAGPVDSSQTSSSMHALVSRERPRVSNTLRYDHHAAANSISSAFEQHYDDLGYELIARASDRTRADIRAGRRATASRFQAPADSTLDEAYRPPDGGSVELYYGTATITHQPNARVAVDANLGYNSERATAAATGSLLMTTTARVIPLAGVTLHGSGTYGQRQQDVAGVSAAALTRAVGAGAEYGIRHRAVHASAGYDAEQAWSRSDLAIDGRGRSWRARAETGVDIFTIAQVNVGIDRDRAEDQVLTLGNQRQERTHASARTLVTTRVVLDGTYERALIDRGVEPLTFRMRYTQATTNLSIQLARQRRAAFTAGEFVNRTFATDERHQYLGVSFSGAIVGALQLTTTARRERTMSEVPRLDQDGSYIVGTLDYRLRLFLFSFEYRYTDLVLVTATRIDPLAFTGNQLALRVGRKFGMGR